jgi:hypothetical protein
MPRLPLIVPHPNFQDQSTSLELSISIVIPNNMCLGGEPNVLQMLKVQHESTLDKQCVMGNVIK